MIKAEILCSNAVDKILFLCLSTQNTVAVLVHVLHKALLATTSMF
jgi:hypothetical protein